MQFMDFDKRLHQLGIELPVPASPAFDYVPALFSGAQLFISGQLGFWDGRLGHTGRLGDTATLSEGRDAARLCALNVLAQVHLACGGTLNRVVRCLRITGFVSSHTDCHEHGAVMNGCSELLHTVLGEAGRHTRSSVGVASLPFNAVVEVDAIFEVTVPSIIR